MKLAIFDVDGTLTNTNQVDAVCFVRAVSEVLGIDLSDTRWSGFTMVTDSGITDELYQRHLGRSPTAEEIASLRARFIELLDEAAAQMPEAFGEVPGAAEVLLRLHGKDGWVAAIATGCWRRSALLKLQSAGIGAGELPAAFAEDGLAREQILNAAIERALAHYGPARFERVVSVGDGPWDVKAAQRLCLPFVGVRYDAAAEPLRNLGASHVLSDLRDLTELLHSLEAASVPEIR